MTREQSKTLKIGDRVCWQRDNADPGIVAETSWASITIKWDSRTDQTIMHNDMAQIDLAT
jgi:hypothetical protein